MTVLMELLLYHRMAHWLCIRLMFLMAILMILMAILMILMAILMILMAILMIFMATLLFLNAIRIFNKCAIRIAFSQDSHQDRLQSG